MPPIKKIKKKPIADRRRKALLDHFQNMEHSLLVSFLSSWLTDSEVKYLCNEEGITVE